MKPAFLILPLAITLCACAEQTMTADAGDCKSVAAAYRSGGSAALLGAGVNPMLALLASDDRSATRIVHAAVTTDCVRKNPTPRSYDLHKIGDSPALPGILVGSNNAGAACPKARGA